MAGERVAHDRGQADEGVSQLACSGENGALKFALIRINRFTNCETQAACGLDKLFCGLRLRNPEISGLNGLDGMSRDRTLTRHKWDLNPSGRRDGLS